MSLPHLLLAAVGISLALTTAAEPLENGFLNPPDSAKPWTYWVWFAGGGRWSKEGATADLEAMKRVGLGGFLLLQTSWQTPPGPVTFVGKEWREMIGYAVAEAGRLGL